MPGKSVIIRVAVSVRALKKTDVSGETLRMRGRRRAGVQRRKWSEGDAPQKVR